MQNGAFDSHFDSLWVIIG